MQHTQKPIILKGMEVYTEHQFIQSGYILIENQHIAAVGSINELNSISSDYEVIEIPPEYKAVPGFIDIHIHGAHGADAMDATHESLQTLTTNLPKEGTTSFLATTMTQSSSSIENALIHAGEFIHKQQHSGQAEILGIHLEGPFINSDKAGAQPVEYIVPPSIDVFKRWHSLSRESIKIVTLAPEMDGGLDLVEYLHSQDIIASIGHSNATYLEVNKAIEKGSTQVTHLFNQMSGIHHREPGVVGAAFLHDSLLAELIVDGIHVRREIVKLAFKQKGPEGLLLITDAMRAKGLPDGLYDLGGQSVNVKEGEALLSDGTLAGSVVTLNQALKNMMNFSGCTLHEAVLMASVNPAKQVNVYDRKGSISVGKDADLVILDSTCEVAMTYCQGKCAYVRDGGGN
ncbi:N-acetylglucosamine-6-phosphate deacetylase [Alkalihalobacillus sp. NPDC078783]